MRRLLSIPFATCIALASTLGALAAPIAPLSSPATAIVKVAGGCGIGRHRGPLGGCLLNFAHPARHICPRGFHLGPGGNCRGNRI